MIDGDKDSSFTKRLLFLWHEKNHWSCQWRLHLRTRHFKKSGQVVFEALKNSKYDCYQIDIKLSSGQLLTITV